MVFPSFPPASCKTIELGYTVVTSCPGSQVIRIKLYRTPLKPRWNVFFLPSQGETIYFFLGLWGALKNVFLRKKKVVEANTASSHTALAAWPA